MSHKEIKVGDRVYSKKYNLGGVVREIGPCGNEGCDKLELTFDKKGKGVRFYYHTDIFEVVDD